MRIGLDTLPLAPPYTGVGNYMLSLLDALIAAQPADANRHVFVGFGARSWHAIDPAFVQDRIGLVRHGDPAAWKEGPSGEVSAVRRTARLLSSMPFAHRLAGRLRGAIFEATVAGQRLDLFHAFIHRAPSRIPRLPVIPVIHDLAYLRHPETVSDSRRRWLEPVAEQCRQAPVIQAVSDFTAREIVALFGIARERIQVIPPAVREIFVRSDSRSHLAALADLGLEPHRFLLCVASLEPRKNLRTVLAAYDGLEKAQRLRHPLVLVGGGHAAGWGDARDHARLDRLEREGSVRRPGHIGDERLVALYHGAMALLFPSLYEGYGMPIIEAMACGATVIAANAAAMPEAMRGQGRLLPALDVDAWRDAIRCLIEADAPVDGEAAALRRQIALSWGWPDAARATLDLYESARKRL